MKTNEYFKTLLGKKVTAVNGKEGEEDLIIHFENGIKLHFYHNQDCCESVYIESITGDLNDLVGVPLLMCEEVCNDEDEVSKKHDFGRWDESHTWTFYKFASIKGYVTVRWLGKSNGYYSESVTCNVWVGRNVIHSFCYGEE